MTRMSPGSGSHVRGVRMNAAQHERYAEAARFAGLPFNTWLKRSCDDAAELERKLRETDAAARNRERP